MRQCWEQVKEAQGYEVMRLCVLSMFCYATVISAPNRAAVSAIPERHVPHPLHMTCNTGLRNWRTIPMATARLMSRSRHLWPFCKWRAPICRSIRKVVRQSVSPRAQRSPGLLWKGLGHRPHSTAQSARYPNILCAAALPTDVRTSVRMDLLSDVLRHRVARRRNRLDACKL